MEQTMRPIPLKYTLDTTFILTNNPTDTYGTSSQAKSISFDGYFRQGDSLYGRVIWNGDNTDRKTSYKLELEKIYICQSDSKQFVPFYDPEGIVSNKAPQFGCAREHKSLRHRLLVLDKNSPANKNMGVEFDTQYGSTADGFKLDVSGLFALANQSQSGNIEEDPWFIQVIYVISLGDSTVYKRSANVYSLNNIYNNGKHILINKKKLIFE